MQSRTRERDRKMAKDLLPNVCRLGHVSAFEKSRSAPSFWVLFVRGTTQTLVQMLITAVAEGGSVTYELSQL
jgi:hypothetical protein